MHNIYTTPLKFIQLIKEIALAYGFDLSLNRACLELNKDADNLKIEKLNSKIIRIGQYRQIGRLTHPSPEIEFLIEDLRESFNDQHNYWTPLRVQVGFDFRQIAWVNSDGVIIDVNLQGLKEAATLCESWTDRINRQNWSFVTQPTSGVTAIFQYISDELRGIKIFTH